MEQKSWYLSKTIWGAVLAVAGLAFPKIAEAIGGTDVLIEVAGAVATVVGSILAVYGRYKATTTVGK